MGCWLCLRWPCPWCEVGPQGLWGLSSWQWPTVRPAAVTDKGLSSAQPVLQGTLFSHSDVSSASSQFPVQQVSVQGRKTSRLPLVKGMVRQLIRGTSNQFIPCRSSKEPERPTLGTGYTHVVLDLGKWTGGPRRVLRHFSIVGTSFTLPPCCREGG